MITMTCVAFTAALMTAFGPPLAQQQAQPLPNDTPVPSQTTITQRQRAFTPADLSPGHVKDPRELLADLNAYELVELALPRADAPDQFDIAFTISGKPVTLQLFQHSIRTPDFKAYIELGNGASIEFDPGPERTYRGVATQFPGSIVSATLMPGGRLTARIQLSDTEVWHVEEVTTLGSGTHAVFRDQDKSPLPDNWCAVEDQVLPGGNDEPSGASDRTGVFQARIAVEGDFEWYDEWGSDWYNEIAGIINDDNAIYEPQTGVCFRISAARVWVANNDPYVDDNASNILGAFRNRYYFNAPMSGEFRHVGQLFSGKDFDGSTIGLGGTDSITTCGPAALDWPEDIEIISAGWTSRRRSYSIIESILMRSRRVEVSSHELGHNWSCSHCDGDPTCGIMNSSATKWPLPGRTTFGSTSANQIISRRNSISECGRACDFDSNNALCTGYCSYGSASAAHASAPAGSVVRVYPAGRAVGGTDAWAENFLWTRPMTLTAPSGPVVIGQ